jgi:hypothetical protein
MICNTVYIYSILYCTNTTYVAYFVCLWLILIFLSFCQTSASMECRSLSVCLSVQSWLLQVKKKVKCTLVQALRLCTGRTAHRGSRGVALLFHDHGTRRGWGVSGTHRSLFTPGNDPVPLYKRLDGTQGRSGQVRKILPPTGFDPRTVQRIASHYTDWATRPKMLSISCEY